MIDFNDLIGLEVDDACKILNSFGYNKINKIKNSKEDERCNCALVCAVRADGDIVTLIYGDFLVEV